MAIFLGILKIIGIVLLVILLIVLFLICLVLFVPIRYEASGQKTKEDMSGRARITWLFHAVSFTVGYNADGTKGLKKEFALFGIPFEKIRDFFKNRGKNKRKKYLQKLKAEDPKRYEEMKAEAMARKAAEENKKAEEAKKAAKERRAEQERKAKEADARASEAEKEPSNRSFFQKAGSFFKKILSLIAILFKKAHSFLKAMVHLPETLTRIILNLSEKISGICDTIGQWIDFLTDERTIEALKTAKKKIIGLLRHIKPRKLSGEVHYGLDDPSKTGMVLAGISALYPIYGGHVSVVPDFEDKVFEGHLEVKGRIFLYYLVWIGLTTLLNKNVRFVISYFKSLKEEKKNG